MSNCREGSIRKKKKGGVGREFVEMVKERLYILLVNFGKILLRTRILCTRAHSIEQYKRR
jgi:hypothetical protein